MSETVAVGGGLEWQGRPSTAVGTAAAAGPALDRGRRPDGRRALQLALAAIWLLDGVLQYQSFMFSAGFSQLIGGTANGNPGIIARPITWNADLVAHHLVLLNTVFATTQLLIGLGIACRPTLRPALAASVAWSAGVWWLGEGLGGVLNGTASPLNGAPGAVIIYALLAVLLWPADRTAPAPFCAARAVGARAARALWLVLWLSLAYFAVTPDNRAPRRMSSMISGMAAGEPRWLAALDRDAAALIGGHGLAASAALAVALVVVAVGVYLPRTAAIAALLLAIVAAAMLWVFGQALGGILAGGGTDPNSGPLLVLLALAYWPASARRSVPRPPAAHRKSAAAAEGMLAP